MIYPIIMHHDNSADHTEALKRQLHGIDYHVYDSSANKTTFTQSFNNCIDIYKSLEGYTHVMICNNDISLTAHQVRILSKGINTCDGIFHPAVNSPHDYNMQVVGIKAYRYVHFVEFVCPIISNNILKYVGKLDDNMTMGYGIDVDYCYRAQEKGAIVALCQYVQIHHYEHQSQDNHNEYRTKAESEMNEVLTRKYGPQWRVKLKCDL